MAQYGGRVKRLFSLGWAGTDLLRATLAQPLAVRFQQSSCRIYQGGLSAHQSRTRPDHRQVNLCLRTAVLHRAQQLGIDSCQPRQRARNVQLIGESSRKR
jgi:hypothetical protein